LLFYRQNKRNPPITAEHLMKVGRFCYQKLRRFYVSVEKIGRLENRPISMLHDRCIWTIKVDRQNRPNLSLYVISINDTIGRPTMEVHAGCEIRGSGGVRPPKSTRDSCKVV